MQNNKLLCLFTKTYELDKSIKYIQSFFVNVENIFIYNTDQKNQMFCTFIINQYYELPSNIIIIHRKSTTNTLYSINAINCIIQNINNGQLIKNFPIDWELYKNQLLLYRANQLEYINHTLSEKI